MSGLLSRQIQRTIMKSEYKNKFLENYTNKVLPKLKELEQTRCDMLKGFYPGTPSQLAKEFNRQVKEQCTKDLVSCFDFILRYGRITEENFVSADEVFEIPLFMNCNADDCISGEYKNVPFFIVENYEPEGIFNSKYKSALRNNIFINIKNNKKSKCKVQVLNKEHNFNWLVWIISSIISILYFFNPEEMTEIRVIMLIIGIIMLIIGIICWHDFVKAEKIKLEDQKFAKEYVVLANDQVEARYLLTTAFMERLNNLKTVFGGKISCCFHDDNVSFLINTDRDTFEISDINIKTTDMTLPNRFFDEMMAITDMIDYFKLDERTGLCKYIDYGKTK